MEDRKRALLFWHTCLPLRATLATIAFLAPRTISLVLALYLGGWGVGLLYRFAHHCVHYRDTPEYGNFGGVVWWQWPRLVHACLLLAYAIGTLFAWPLARWCAVADVAFGAAAGAVYFVLRPCPVLRAP